MSFPVESVACGSEEPSDPSLTVSGLGDEGVESIFGVIYPRLATLAGTVTFLGASRAEERHG